MLKTGTMESPAVHRDVVDTSPICYRNTGFDLKNNNFLGRL
jgi:hypothetical protein